jgi:hypothetical protein
MQQSALSLLQPDELCIVVLHDGSQREGAWTPVDQSFTFVDGKGAGYVLASDVYEWWPASVRF